MRVPAVTVAVLALCAAVPAQGQSGPRSAQDGVYLAEQAERGEDVFLDVCANCHSGSEFRGENFQLNWVGRTVRDLFRLVSTSMPQDSPGRLSEQQYVDVIAYLLKMNKYPAGETALVGDEATLRRIRIEEPAGRQPSP